jgi:hypothetical protein
MLSVFIDEIREIRYQKSRTQRLRGETSVPSRLRARLELLFERADGVIRGIDNIFYR